MKINDSSANSLRLSQVKPSDKQSLVKSQDEQTRAKAQESQQSKAQSSANKTRFDVDQYSLARVEQFSQEGPNNVNSSASQSVNGSYDQPSQQNQSAVNSYRSVENIAQRESIKQTFGVDLFA
ncbi:hypothetical protein ACOYR1_11575 [Thalassotalea piscium]